MKITNMVAIKQWMDGFKKNKFEPNEGINLKKYC
jgi:hypothetical protein